MKKITLSLILLLGVYTSLAEASLPLPNVVGSVGPGGGIIASMQAQEDLRRQQLDNQMLQEQISMMQQQREIQTHVHRRE